MPTKVHDLKPAPGSKPKKQRVARGIGGRRGKTAGTGTKGQGTRDTIKPGFEGGQTPLTRRTPSASGRYSIKWATRVSSTASPQRRPLSYCSRWCVSSA